MSKFGALIVVISVILPLEASAQDTESYFRQQLTAPLIINSISDRPTDPLESSIGGSWPNVAIAGDSFSSTVLTSGGVPPYTISVVEGEVPSGFVLSGSAISGFFTASTDAFTLRVTDSVDDYVDIAFLAVDVTQPLAFLSQPSNQSSTSADTVRIPPPAISGGIGPYQVSILGSLPSRASFSSSAGLTFNRSPSGTYNLRFRVTDAEGQVATSDPFTVTLASTPAMRMTLPGGTRVSFLGWTAVPSTFKNVQLQTTGAIAVRSECQSSNLSLSLLIYASRNNWSEVGVSVYSTDCSVVGNDGWVHFTGQNAPVTIFDKNIGTLPENHTEYNKNQVTWARFNY